MGVFYFYLFQLKIDLNNIFLYLKMWTIQKQFEEKYKTINPDKLVLGNKYLFILNNYKIFGEFKGIHKRKWSNVKYSIVKDMICNISPNGFKIFSLEDIRIRQAQRYFKDKLPYEINIIIGKKWAKLEY